ncbi:MAG TPA: SpoIIE family protein phosphatase [Leptospiraceae bacterium]|nr:SpoIIE family protein phosphatase [Leptospiraceae bacterium]HNN05386.1 SpoIIE family protein phosphatase [Leptospiraceae bacterium]
MLKYGKMTTDSVRQIFFLLISAMLIHVGLYAEDRVLNLGTVGNASVSLTEYISVLEDPGRSLTLNDVSSGKNSESFRTVKSSGGALNFSFSSSAFWLRFKIKNTDAFPRELKAVISYPRLEYIDFFVPDRNGYRTVRSGYSVPYDERPEKSRFFVFPLTLPAEAEQVFYFRISSQNSVNIPVSLWDKNAYYKYELNDHVIQALYFGIVISMALFNLLIYTILRDINYILYVTFIILTGFTIASYNGIASELFWNHSPWLDRVAVNALISSVLVLFLLFMRRMLSTKTVIPRLDKVNKFLIAGQVVICILYLISFSIFVKVIVISHALTGFWILCVGGVCAYRRQRSAYFFVMAFGVLFIAIILGTLRALGLLPVNPFTVEGPQFGSALEMILLAFALADRYNILRKEKEKAQEEVFEAQAKALQAEQQLVENLKASERLLEQKVQERTSELNSTLKIIRQDLSIAKKIQKNTLLINPAFQKELNIAVSYIPMAEVGGDFYDIFKVNDCTYRIFQADATGHGVQAAMITMAIKGIYDNVKKFDLDPSEIMEIFNNEYMIKYESLNSLMTAFIADIDTQKGTVKYVSAGHPAAMIQKDGGDLFLNSTGRMIGIMKNVQYQSGKVQFSAKDRLFLFTDGIFEEFNERREMFGEERLYSVLSSCRKLPIEEVFQTVLENLTQYMNGTKLQDDIAILGIEYR